MLIGLGKATEDHSENHGFFPGSADEVAFNAALAIIDGVRPKDQIEAMLASAYMRALTRTERMLIEP